MAREKICGIYSITNIITNKLYIGSSNDIYRRWREHKNLLKKGEHHSKHLQRAWDKYGSDNFAFCIIEKCSDECKLDREQYYMDLYNSYDAYYGYNDSELARCPTMTDKQREYYAKISSERLQGEGSWSNIYTESQIIDLINDLMTGEYSHVQLSQKHDISYDIVASVARHTSWNYLTKDLIFPNPKTSSRENVKLTEHDVDEIIDLLLKGECNKVVSSRYNVHPKTISDIRNHKSWGSKTKNIIFNKSNRSKAYDTEKLKKNVIELKNKQYTYTEIAKELNISISWVCALVNK